LQVVIALVITPDGFPVAYEVMKGNTSGRSTLRDFLDKIEKTYGKAKRMGVYFSANCGTASMYSSSVVL
jgi:transposase